MKIPAIQKDIVAHLRTAGTPETSRALAARFLRIDSGDEETCRRLLAPFLSAVPGVRHDPASGWSYAAPSARPSAAPRDDAPAATPSRAVGSDGLGDFVAIASEGSGPGGSGEPVRVSLVPVLAGIAGPEEMFPSWAFDDERVERAPDGSGPLAAGDLAALVETVGDLPIVCHRVAREIEPLRRLALVHDVPFTAPVISAARLGHLMLALKPSHAAVDLAQALGVATRGPDDCRGRARLVAESFLRLAGHLEAKGIDTLSAVLEYQSLPASPIDLSGRAFGHDDLKALPAAPGVYRFFDRRGALVYVGKAASLRTRVGSYFTPGASATAKGRAILDSVHRVEIERTASELEAGLLEAALIAEHRPPLNRQFDVHERPAPYGPRLNLVVVLRDDDAAATCTLHLLRGGRYLARVAGISEDEDRWNSTRDLVARHYFGAATDAAERPDAGVDIDWQLVGSYLRRYRDEVNVLDVDECATAADAATRLRVLARAAATARRVLAR